MAKLILSLDGVVIREFALNKERTTIGRKPQNDIQVDNLAVSGHHAAIITILSDSFMEDLGSTNGTLVNGNPVKKHFLQNGDVIEVGKHKLRYVADSPAAEDGTDFERTMVLRVPVGAPPVSAAGAAMAAARDVDGDGGVALLARKAVGSPAAAVLATGGAVTAPAPDPRRTLASAGSGALAGSAPSAAVAEAPAIAAPPAGSTPGITSPAALQVLNGPHAGRVLELAKSLTTLGRPGIQVAVITRRPAGYFITHVEGALRPVLNGVPLTPHASPLKDHDVIEIAGVKMEFFLKS